MNDSWALSNVIVGLNVNSFWIIGKLRSVIVPSILNSATSSSVIFTPVKFVIADIFNLTLTENSFESNVDSSKSLNTNPGFAVKVSLLILPVVVVILAVNDSWAWRSSISAGNLNSFWIITKLRSVIVPAVLNLAISSSVISKPVKSEGVITNFLLTKKLFEGKVGAPSLNTNPGFAIKIIWCKLVLPEIGDKVALNDSWAWGSSIARGNSNSFWIISKLFISIIPSGWNLAISSSVINKSSVPKVIIDNLTLTVIGFDGNVSEFSLIKYPGFAIKVNMYGLASLLETFNPFITLSLMEESIVNIFEITSNIRLLISWGPTLIKANSSFVRINSLMFIGSIANLTLTVIGSDGNVFKLSLIVYPGFVDKVNMYLFSEVGSFLETFSPFITLSLIESLILNTFLIILHLVSSISWGNVVIDSNSNSLIADWLVVGFAFIANLTTTWNIFDSKFFEFSLIKYPGFAVNLNLNGFSVVVNSSVLETFNPFITSSLIEVSKLNTFEIMANILGVIGWGDVLSEYISSLVRWMSSIAFGVINNLVLTVNRIDDNSSNSLLIT